MEKNLFDLTCTTYKLLDEKNDAIIKSKAKYDRNHFEHNSPSNSEHANLETVKYYILLWLPTHTRPHVLFPADKVKEKLAGKSTWQ